MEILFQIGETNSGSQYIYFVSNYPTFNPSTVIKYQLPANVFVTLKIFDILGREVETLVNDYQNAGKYSVQYNASNLPSGAYFFRLEAGTYQDSKKLLLLK
jgi:hypothetical protein